MPGDRSFYLFLIKDQKISAACYSMTAAICRHITGVSSVLLQLSYLRGRRLRSLLSRVRAKNLALFLATLRKKCLIDPQRLNNRYSFLTYLSASVLLYRNHRREWRSRLLERCRNTLALIRRQGQRYAKVLAIGPARAVLMDISGITQSAPALWELLSTCNPDKLL